MLTGKKGVDLSNWQAEMTNSGILTDAGIKFAILKLSEGRSFADGRFDFFYDACKKADIAVGAYVYSHAASGEAGKAEAEFALQCLGGRTLELPLYLDMEGDILNSGKAALTESALAFADTVRRAGYRPGVYASLYPFRTVLNASELRNAGISIWCAAYNDSGPGLDCDIWQYSDTGRLFGYDGNLDMDIMINDIIERVPAPAEESREMKKWPADMSVLCRGFHGTQVEALQLLLGLRPTGVFGRDTESAVKEFQQLCGIADDGIAGPQTFSKFKERLR